MSIAEIPNSIRTIALKTLNELGAHFDCEPFDDDDVNEMFERLDAVGQDDQ